VPRTDENGRQLRTLLDYLLDGKLTTKQMHEALGISSSLTIAASGTTTTRMPTSCARSPRGSTSASPTYKSVLDS
jgi:hypothetical protein